MDLQKIWPLIAKPLKVEYKPDVRKYDIMQTAVFNELNLRQSSQKWVTSVYQYPVKKAYRNCIVHPLACLSFCLFLLYFRIFFLQNYKAQGEGVFYTTLGSRSLFVVQGFSLPLIRSIPKAKSPFPNGKSKLFSPILMKVKDENKGQKSAVLYRELCVLLLSVLLCLLKQTWMTWDSSLLNTPQNKHTAHSQIT